MGPKDNLIDVTESGVTGWMNVKVVFRSGKTVKGYLPAAAIELVKLHWEDIKYDKFVNVCAHACADRLIDLQYLLALARVESGTHWNDTSSTITGGAYEGTGAIGPFQFMPKTWKAYVDQHSHEVFVTYTGIGDPGQQAILAAYTVDEAINAHEKKFGVLPTISELYLYHFLGMPAAQDVLGAGRTRSIADVLTERGHDAQAMISGNESVFLSGGAPRSVDQVLDEVYRRLSVAYGQNRSLLQNAPDWYPIVADGRDAPWLATAEAEMAKGVSEAPSRDSDTNPNLNDSIAAYLESVGFGANEPYTTPWCAAFVHWCLKNCGDDKAAEAADTPKPASQAKAWLMLPEAVGPQKGAIAVKKSHDPRYTGHVGFVDAVSDDGSEITLLGGNQSPSEGGGVDRVCLKVYPAADMLGYRWPKPKDR
ncbi:CHAP domain-containing protein [Martelella radicis]|uniref:Uncharacterized protein (TIGR02594 family) n=1 Tax=Martelella radicis TaxID=1397476 RepID=A0A7W6P9T8_9HYPH|nr:CHAP domain-containing protein [Martelella radicis]MBB4121721.1 uncharacterized protein (TIGR02594 family) [Martelella radicis]